MSKKKDKKKREKDNLSLLVGILYDISESLQVIAYAIDKERKLKEKTIQKGTIDGIIANNRVGLR